MDNQEQHHVLSDDDGYTLTRYIQEEPRMHAALRFTYRPVGSIMRLRFRDRAPAGENEEAALRRSAVAVAHQLVQWSGKDRKGNPLPVTAESVLSLHPRLQMRLISIVLHSLEGGDADPEAVQSSARWNPADPFGTDADAELVEGEQKNS